MDLVKPDLDMEFGNKYTPFIAIWMVTYNHGNFISQAIESVLKQNTNFSFKLFIGEDNSDDDTREKCIAFKKNNHNKIEIFLNDTNLGPNKNAKRIYKECFSSGAKYIFLIEGDDYWTDSFKLQKQVDFLEANPDYAICYHKVQVLEDGVLQEDTITAEVPETTTIKDLARGNFIHTCSVAFRNNLFEKLPDYFDKSPIGDYFLHMLNARYGKIKFLDEFMGVYRLHETSVWSSKKQEKRDQIWLTFLKRIRKNFDQEVKEILDIQISQFENLRKKRRLEFFKQVAKRVLFIK